jgi:hypothetical protein
MLEKTENERVRRREYEDIFQKNRVLEIQIQSLEKDNLIHRKFFNDIKRSIQTEELSLKKNKEESDRMIKLVDDPLDESELVSIGFEPNF